MRSIKLICGIACFVIALVSAGWGIINLFTNDRAPEYVVVSDCNYHPENDGKYVYMQGKPTFSGSVSDPITGVKIKAPLLKRKVEMYQFLYNGTADKKTMYRGWSTKYEAGFTDRFDRKYSNPQFPEGIRSEDFGGELTFNNGTLKLDKNYATKFGYGSYVDFKDSYARLLVNVKNLPTGRIPEGFVLSDKNTYYKENTKPVGSIFDNGNNRYAMTKRTGVKVGDVRITYQGLTTAKLPECTIIGKQVNGVIQYADNGHLVDYLLQESELDKFYRSSSRTAFFGAIVCAVLLSLLGFYIIT